MKKVIIIGGGIAGLTAGIYLEQSGFNTTIYESHSNAGGFCTSWRRGGYLFEGGMHWLGGSRKDMPLYNAWKELGAINDSTQIYFRDPFVTFDYNGHLIYIYRDLEKLISHFTEIAPEDKKEINKLYKDVKAFQKMNMPIMDIKGVKVKKKSSIKMNELLAMFPAMLKFNGLSNLTATEYAAQFKSPALRAFLGNIMGDDTSSIGVISTLATITSGDGGYLKGGSLSMVLGMVNRYQSLGGKIEYNTSIDKVIMDNGNATGVVTGGKELFADAVIVTQDTLTAIDKLFDKPLNDTWMNNLRKNTSPMLNVFVSLGIEADLSALPESLIFSLKKPLRIGNVETYSLNINNYAIYEGYAPKGCTALTTAIMGDSYEFWKKCKENGTYGTEKHRLADTVINQIAEKWEQVKGKVAVIDVATPLTYERYCGSFKGSWMSCMRKGDKMITYPIANNNLKNLYFAGQRMSPPGGLTSALDTG